MSHMDALDNATKAVADELTRQLLDSRGEVTSQRFDARKLAKSALIAAAYTPGYEDETDD